MVRSDLLRAEVELARIDDLLAEARGNARVAEANLGFRLGEPIGTAYALGAARRSAAARRASARTGSPPPTAARDLAGARKLLERRRARGQGHARRALPAHRRRRAATTWSTTSCSAATATRRRSSRWRASTSSTAAGSAPRSPPPGPRPRPAAPTSTASPRACGSRAKQAYESAAVALERRATAASALDAAAEAVRIIEERFRAGVVKTTDLLDAATARREAEMRELVARAEAWLAQLRLALAAGEAPESILVHPRHSELLRETVAVTNRIALRSRFPLARPGARRLRRHAAPAPSRRAGRRSPPASPSPNGSTADRRTELAGTVAAEKSTAVSSRVMAMVTAVHVQMGDEVARRPDAGLDRPERRRRARSPRRAARSPRPRRRSRSPRRNHERFQALAATQSASELEVDLARMQFEQAAGRGRAGAGRRRRRAVGGARVARRRARSPGASPRGSSRSATSPLPAGRWR